MRHTKDLQMRVLRNPKITQWIRVVLLIYLFVSGSISIISYLRGHLDDISMIQNAYLLLNIMNPEEFNWLGLFKLISALLLIPQRTTKFIIASMVGYTLIVLTKTIFYSANHWILAAFLLITNGFLIFAYWDWYRLLFEVEVED